MFGSILHEHVLTIFEYSLTHPKNYSFYQNSSDSTHFSLKSDSFLNSLLQRSLEKHYSYTKSSSLTKALSFLYQITSPNEVIKPNEAQFIGSYEITNPNEDPLNHKLQRRRNHELLRRTKKFFPPPKSEFPYEGDFQRIDLKNQNRNVSGFLFFSWCRIFFTYVAANLIQFLTPHFLRFKVDQV